jgi:hypothetical protein
VTPAVRSRFRRCRRSLAAALTFVPAAPAIQLPRFVPPPLEGVVAGRLDPGLFPGAPEVDWRATGSRVGDRRRWDASLSAPGLRLRLRAELDGQGDGDWSAEIEELDLGAWLPAVQSLLPPDLAALTVSGQLTGTARGAVAGGRLTGQASLSLREGQIGYPPLKARVEGVAADLTGIELGDLRAPPGQRLKWTQARVEVLETGPGSVEFGLAGAELTVTRGIVALLGGEVMLADAVLALDRPRLAVEAEARGLELPRIAALLPPVVASAAGRLDGRLSVRREEGGFQLGNGRLALREGESAEVRFAPSPGLLSSQLPDLVRRHYPGLIQLEAGGVPLLARELEIRLTPAGDAEGRTARIRLKGGPADPALQAPVELEVNVRGPLDSLVQFGTHHRVRFGEGAR